MFYAIDSSVSKPGIAWMVDSKDVAINALVKQMDRSKQGKTMVKKPAAFTTTISMGNKQVRIF